ncbi:MAG TPA: hypothetical protein VMJ92_01560 [Candidatus Limnocylindrales bacterium]|nr:hypothetical protein [Candidatus Limnocylindrales bacterium]
MTIPRLTTARHARPLGLALVAWGLLGLALIAFIAVSVGPALASADALGERETATEIRAALETTVRSLDGVGLSVADGREAAEDAARAVRDIAATTDQLAGAMSISFLGAQPFLPIAEGFRRQTASLEQLGQDLDALARALIRNQRDVEDLRASAVVLRDRVERIVPAESTAAPTIRPLLYALLGWLALQAFAALGAGAWLLRSPRPPTSLAH